MPEAQDTNPSTLAQPVDFDRPWLGLRSFGEDDTDLFFGRQTERHEILRCVQHRHTTVLYGGSGLGKTSLLRAGLTRDLLTAGYQPIFHRIRYGPEEAPPAVQLIALLSDVYKGPISRLTDLYVLLHDPAFGFCGPFARYKPPVFLLDQFEEVFTLGAELNRTLKGKRDVLAEVRDVLAVLGQNFIPKQLAADLENDEDLCGRLDQESHPSRVVLSLRDDYVFALDRWRRELPALGDNRYELLPLTGDKAYLAVLEPGKLRDPSRPIVTPECATEIVRFVAGDKEQRHLDDITVVPPLLSLICEQLNAYRIKHGREQIEPNFQKDTAEEILEDYYQNRFRDRPLELRMLVEEQLLSAEGHRQPVNVDTAQRTLENVRGNYAARRLLDDLVAERLLTIVEHGSLRRYELTHDILCPIVRRSRDARRELEEKNRLAKEAEMALSKQHEAELQAAQRAAELRRIRRLAVFLLILSVLCLAAIAYSVVKDRESRRSLAIAREQRQRAEEASTLARQKAVESQQQKLAAEEANKQATAERNNAQELLRKQSQRDLALAISRLSEKKTADSVPLAARALREWPGNDAASIFLWLQLRRGVANRQVPLWRIHLPTEVTGNFVWSDDSKMLAVDLDDGRIGVITIYPQPVLRIFGEVPTPSSDTDKAESTGEHSTIALRPEQGVLVAKLGDGGWALWDLASGKNKVIPGSSQSTKLASISPRELRAVVWLSEGSACVVDLTTGKTGKQFSVNREKSEVEFTWKKDGSEFLYVDSSPIPKKSKDQSPVWRLQRRNGQTGISIGEGVKVSKISKMQLDSTASHALFIIGTEDSEQVEAAVAKTAAQLTELWELQPQPHRLESYENLREAGWHPLTGRLLVAKENDRFEQYELQGGKLTKTTDYLGSLSLYMRDPRAESEESQSCLFGGSSRRQEIELPWGDSAAAIYDFADEDWVNEPELFGEADSSFHLSPDGAMIVTISAEGEEWDPATIEICGLRGPLTTGWRERFQPNLMSPIASPDGEYEISVDSDKQGFLRRKGDRKSFPPIPLPFPELDRAEWSLDGRELILISSSKREQHWAWPPPRRWEPSLDVWLAEFGVTEDEQAAIELRKEDKSGDQESEPRKAESPSTRQASVEPAHWLDALRNAKLSDPAWQELQKWWLAGRPGPNPQPAPASPAN